MIATAANDGQNLTDGVAAAFHASNASKVVLKV
jgi:hypothetical protein